MNVVYLIILLTSVLAGLTTYSNLVQQDLVKHTSDSVLYDPNHLDLIER